MEAASLIQNLLQRDADLRLGSHNDAAEIKVHPWFRGVDWKALAEKKIAPSFRYGCMYVCICRIVLVVT